MIRRKRRPDQLLLRLKKQLLLLHLAGKASNAHFQAHGLPDIFEDHVSTRVDFCGFLVRPVVCPEDDVSLIAVFAYGPLPIRDGYRGTILRRYCQRAGCYGIGMASEARVG